MNNITTETTTRNTVQRADGVKPKAWAKAGLLSSPAGWWPSINVAFATDCTEEEVLAIVRAAMPQAINEVVQAKAGKRQGVLSEEAIERLSEGFTDGSL